jgi:hypothetical protein
MLKDKEESQKLDPKPLRAKPKKYTYGKGWHRLDDGRATMDDIIKTNPKPDEKGILNNLFVRQDHPARHLYKNTEIRAERFGIPLE